MAPLPSLPAFCSVSWGEFYFVLFFFFSFNFELETLLSAQDLCLSHAPGGERFHVIVDVT